MGKDLHPSILPFVLSRLNQHQNVIEVQKIPNDEYYMYKIIRNNGLRDVILVVSDSYYLGELDYLSKPQELNEGGIILIAKPEAHFPNDSQTNITEDRVIIGKIGILLGALRIDEYWTYKKPKEENKNN